MGSPWATSKIKNFFFFSEITKTDPKLSKPFCYNKISMFWLSYECFSILGNAFFLKSVISSNNSCVTSLRLKAKVNKIIILSWQLSYIKQVEVLFPIEETIARLIIAYSKLRPSLSSRFFMSLDCST